MARQYSKLIGFKGSFSLGVTTVALAMLVASPSIADELVYKDNFYVYTVQRGDTLEAIATKFGAEKKIDWQTIAKENKVRKPKALLPGSELKFQLQWIKSQESVATVKSISGSARIDGKALLVGSQVREAAKISTDPKSLVELELADGSILKIGSASEVVIDRLRQYHSNEVVEARIRLEQGRVDSTVTAPRRKPYEVITPGATAAVRGTVFGVSALQGLSLPEADNSAATVDVGSGKVQWAKPTGPGPDFEVLAGFGAAVSKAGILSEPEALLPMARLPVNSILEKPNAQVNFPAVAGAAAYKIDVSDEPGFSRVLTESFQKEPLITIISTADGPHYVKVKALSSKLIEGTSATTLFNVAARPLPPQGMSPVSNTKRFEERSRLTWLETPNASYRIQLASAAGFAQPDLDIKLPANTIEVVLKPGQNEWRVATLDNTGKQGPFSDPLKIERVLLPLPKAGVDEEGAFLELKSDLALSAQGNKLEIQVSKVLAGGVATTKPAVSTHDSTPVRLQFEPGVYELRSRYIIPGMSPDAVPLTPPQTLRFFEPVRSGLGTVLRSSDGSPIELNR